MKRSITLFALLALAGCTPRQAGEKSMAEAIDPATVSVEDVLLSNPDSILWEAINAYNEKDYASSASAYLSYVSHNNSDAISLYNLACCFGLMGDSTRAAAFLMASWDAGYRDAEHIRQDTDFDRVRESSVFKATVKEMDKEAAEKSYGKNRVYVTAKSMLPCYVVVPEDYNAEDRYPLVIGLHGYGSNYDRFSDLFRRDSKSDTAGKATGVDFIYAAPCAPYPMAGGPEPGYSWTLRDEELGEKSLVMDEDYITSLPLEILNSWNVDTTQVYLLGFSQGASTAYFIGLNHPERFKGVIAFGGWLDSAMVSADALKKAKGMKVFIAHGKSDQTVPLEAGQDAYKRLKDAGLDVQLNQFEGGHEVPIQTLQFAIEWLGI
jgi:phospholipase/carboxylesterase